MGIISDSLFFTYAKMKPTQLLLKLGVILAILLLQPLRGSRLVSHAADTQASDEIEGNIDDVARAILTYFPKVKGEVVALKGEEIKVDLGGKRGLAKGTLLTVYREGAFFRHPVTAVPLGRFEDEVGVLEVNRFESPYLLALAVAPIAEMQIGDLVRITATRIPLAISLSSNTDHPFLMNELVSALTDTGRFKIETLSPGTDLNAARKGENRYYIKLATSRRDERFSMDLQIQNTFTGTVLAKLSVLIRQSEESDLILEHLQFQLFEQRQKK